MQHIVWKFVPNGYYSWKEAVFIGTNQELMYMFYPICICWPIRVWDVPHIYGYVGPYAYGTSHTSFGQHTHNNYGAKRI